MSDELNDLFTRMKAQHAQDQGQQQPAAQAEQDTVAADDTGSVSDAVSDAAVRVVPTSLRSGPERPPRPLIRWQERQSPLALSVTTRPRLASPTGTAADVASVLSPART